MDIDKIENACKKRKLSEDRKQPDSKKGETQDPERGSVWMDDGNVVIQAGHTQFCIHRSMLARFSSVFKDMFSLPQPIDHSLEAEGCPVIHLHDSAQDVEHLLTAIYEHKFTVNPIQNELLPIQMLSGLLRLANKYDIPSIRTHMLLRLHNEFPTSLQDVDFDTLLYLDQDDRYTYHLSVDVLSLSVEEGIFSIIPLNLYFILCKYSVEQILNGIEFDGSTKAVLPSTLITQCLIGRERLEEFMWETSYKWLRESATSAPFCDQIPCRKLLRNLEKRVLRPNPNLYYVLTFDWKAFLEEDDALGSLCSVCNEAAGKHHEEGRRAVFDKLPAFFGYLSWEDLKKMDRYQV